MRNVKKLDEIILKPQEMKQIVGGVSCWDGELTNTGGGHLPQPVPKQPEPTQPQPECLCTCYNCIWEDGGAGFSVGMMLNH